MPNCKHRRLTAIASVVLLHSTVLQAAPTAEEIFKSMDAKATDNVALLPAFAMVAAGIGVLMLLAWLSRRVQRKSVDTGYNHPAKLVREIGKTIGLKRAELKQMKLLADTCAADAGESPNPLTLLLCPSVLAKAVAKNPPKIDRQVLAGVVKQLSRSSA
ncbi:MAG TPA: hypothetical protein VK324_12430 [Tepidisphaeraceae bacterium]|nr:hypothetical protein [Tepidisphaeraceae bacterium]